MKSQNKIMNFIKGLLGGLGLSMLSFILFGSFFGRPLFSLLFSYSSAIENTLWSAILTGFYFLFLISAVSIPSLFIFRSLRQKNYYRAHGFLWGAILPTAFFIISGIHPRSSATRLNASPERVKRAEEITPTWSSDFRTRIPSGIPRSLLRASVIFIITAFFVNPPGVGNGFQAKF